MNNMHSVTSNAVAEALECGNDYLKLSSGLLIQWGKISGIKFNANTPTQWTEHYYLPQPFVDTNYIVICDLFDSIRGYSDGTPNLADPRPNTNKVFTVMYSKNRPYSTSDEGTTNQWFAIGRWK